MQLAITDDNTIYLSTPLQSMQFEILEVLKKQLVEKVEDLQIQEEVFNCVSFLKNGYDFEVDTVNMDRVGEIFIFNHWIDIQQQLKEKGLCCDAFMEWDLRIHAVAIDNEDKAHIIFNIIRE